MYDVIIIGAGPAGLTAGLYSGRYRLKSLILEKMAVGGQIVLSSDIENYPGFPGSTGTFDLMDKMKQQVEEVGVEIRLEEVLELAQDKAQGSQAVSYRLKTTENTYETRAIILAVGAQPKRLGVKGEDKCIGHGVSYCGTCDGPLFREKEIAVVGGGDRALEEALFLTRYASRVHLIHRRDALRASAILVDKARDNPKINFILSSVVEEITGKDKVEGLLIKDLKAGAVKELPVSGVFMFVGIIPNTGFLKAFVEMDKDGFIIADQNMRASREGVFACGDCCQKAFRQVVTACSDGANASYSAQTYLDNAQ
ncbi:MAG: thioredoxin-disulfide reductase [Candidatus Omnitrophota bacterium]